MGSGPTIRADTIAPILFVASLSRARDFYTTCVGMTMLTGSSTHAVFHLLSEPSSAQKLGSVSLLRKESDDVIRIWLEERSSGVDPVNGATVVIQLSGRDDRQIQHYQTLVATAFHAWSANQTEQSHASVSQWKRQTIALGSFEIIDPDGNRLLIRQDREVYCG
ncbi:hypothetical protein PYCC9005_000776 [Savitreella phatthalungensis]